MERAKTESIVVIFSDASYVSVIRAACVARAVRVQMTLLKSAELYIVTSERWPNRR